jgi:hypothetical protein
LRDSYTRDTVSEDDSGRAGLAAGNGWPRDAAFSGDLRSKLHSLAVPMGDMGAATGIGTFW